VAAHVDAGRDHEFGVLRGACDNLEQQLAAAVGFEMGLACGQIGHQHAAVVASLHRAPQQRAIAHSPRRDRDLDTPSWRTVVAPRAGDAQRNPSSLPVTTRRRPGVPSAGATPSAAVAVRGTEAPAGNAA
jgi:hypothetical protein